MNGEGKKINNYYKFLLLSVTSSKPWRYLAAGSLLASEQKDWQPESKPLTLPSCTAVFRIHTCSFLHPPGSQTSLRTWRRAHNPRHPRTARTTKFRPWLTVQHSKGVWTRARQTWMVTRRCHNRKAVGGLLAGSSGRARRPSNQSAAAQRLPWPRRLLGPRPLLPSSQSAAAQPLPRPSRMLGPRTHTGETCLQPQTQGSQPSRQPAPYTGRFPVSWAPSMNRKKLQKLTDSLNKNCKHCK